MLLASMRVCAVEVQPLPDPLPQKRETRLEIPSVGANGWWNIAGDSFNPEQPAPVYTLQSSPDLVQWRTAAVLLHTPFVFVDTSPNDATRFYRMVLMGRSEANDWANQVQFATDPFFAGDDCDATTPLRWVKFAIVLAEPHRVFFQDSQKYRLHYEFAVTRLAGFQGLSPEQFNAVALRLGHQQILLGAILVPPAGLEYGIQFVGLDPYPLEFVTRFFELVKSTVAASPGVLAFYLPTFEQSESASQNEAFFAARGIPIASVERWSSVKSVMYSPGWALGRLQFIRAAEISAAYADGRLQPTDILLTDGVPAEIPFVAGIVSLVPATPNSHVAILAQSYGVPFVSLSEPSEQMRAQSLVGQEVILRTGARLSDGKILLLGLGNSLEPTTRAAVLALKQPGEIELVPMSVRGEWSAPTDNLVPADIRYFGGKAANFGLLRRAIPNYSPEAIAFSFDLWRAFLDQTLPSDQTLRAAIQARLGGYTYPANVLALRADLRAVRELITSVASFSSAQRNVILAALTGFDSGRNLRFRSSTNVEDAERFTGAGLYDSFSGCLDDDLDSDDKGPSRCDPTEDDERGIFRAIQRVYASFYNENAFLERLRFRLTEADVGMALLVHHSTPDELEMANGVATLSLRRIGTSVFSQGQLVTQLGAVSVANPDWNARPESVEFYVSASFTNVTLRERSSLVPLGTNVLAWPDEYQVLAGLMQNVARGYSQFDTNRDMIRLDLEYKKIQPGRLEVKQVREVPLPDSTNRAPTFLLGEPGQPTEFAVYGPSFAVHRAKSRWRLFTTNLALQATNLAQTFYPSTQVDFVATSNPFYLDGSPSDWPGAWHAVSNNPVANTWMVTDGWVFGAGIQRREFTLTTELNRTVSEAESPLLTLADARLELRIQYAHPMPAADSRGNITSVDAETVQLFRHPLHDTNPPVPVTLTTNGLTIVASHRMGNVYGPPSTPVICLSPIATKASYAQVSLDGETTIEGLLSKPLTLRNPASQTFLVRGRQGHERIEDLVWDPWLEPGLSAELRSELTSANIGLLYFRSYTFGRREESIQILGLDGVVRPW